MKPICTRAVLVVLGLVLSACATRHPKNAEFKIDSAPLPSAASLGAQTKPFCLHVQYNSKYVFVFSKNLAQAWATEGACRDNGTPRTLGALNLGWRYSWNGQDAKQCANANSCNLNESNFWLGKLFDCVAATGADGDQTAHISSDQVLCP